MVLIYKRSEESGPSSLPKVSSLTLGSATRRRYKKGGIKIKDVYFALDSNVDIAVFFLRSVLRKCNVITEWTKPAHLESNPVLAGKESHLSLQKLLA